MTQEALKLALEYIKQAYKLCLITLMVSHTLLGQGYIDRIKERERHPTTAQRIEIDHLALSRVQAVQMTEAKLKEKNT
jgi:hypothetical protein